MSNCVKYVFYFLYTSYVFDFLYTSYSCGVVVSILISYSKDSGFESPSSECSGQINVRKDFLQALKYMLDSFKYKWYLPFPTNSKVSQGPIYISDLPKISHWHIKVEIIWTFRTGITSILSKPADAGCPRGATFVSHTRHVPFPSTSIIKFIIQYKLIYIIQP